MAGKHEPVSKRSFYYSLTTAALRGILVITALVLGVFVLSKAFPTAGDVSTPENQPTDGASPTTTDSPSPTPTGSPVEPQDQPDTEDFQGLVVQLLNGTDVSGLAASTEKRVERLGFVVPDENGVGDASDFYDVTTIFYQRDAKAAAEYLAGRLFPGATLERSPADADPNFVLTVVLGADFAAADAAA